MRDVILTLLGSWRSVSSLRQSGAILETYFTRFKNAVLLSVVAEIISGFFLQRNVGSGGFKGIE